MENAPAWIRAQAIFDSSLRLVDHQSSPQTLSTRLIMPRAGRVRCLRSRAPTQSLRASDCLPRSRQSLASMTVPSLSPPPYDVLE